MGRVREMVKVDGQECWTLFDIGARSTYVVSTVADKLRTIQTLHPIRTALGGSVKEITRTMLLQAEVQGHLVSTQAMVVDEIGKDEDAGVSRFCSVLWRCGSGASAPSPTKSVSTSAAIQENSSNSDMRNGIPREN